jgi:hypothetical protein
MRHPRSVSRSVIAIAALALGLGGAAASAQSSCDPASTPCQHCPPPPACAPSNTCPDVAIGPPGYYGAVSSTSCAGSFPQVTRTLTSYVGPADLCVGVNASVGCHLAANTHLDLFATETIAASSAAQIPTLSGWALGALAAGLGVLGALALALRRRTLPRPRA